MIDLAMTESVPYKTKEQGPFMTIPKRFDKYHHLNRAARPILTLTMSFLILMASLTGCGSKKNESVETFRSDIDSFAASILEIDAQINTIDPYTDDAVTQLLTYYDALEAEFVSLSELNIPEDYEDVERLADKASEYMTTAVSYFHTAFESETLDTELLSQASVYYEKAFTFVNYIGEVLMGNHITFQSDLNSETNDATE